MLQINNLKGVSDYLPSKVNLATNQPPICDLEKVVGRNQIVRYIEFELVKLASLISVGGNLNNSQIQFIATQLVELFPNDSIADFKICFQRGAIGQYGEIYRMDGIVLRKWMEQYLEEKYDVIEKELMREKEEYYKKHETSSDDIADKYIKQMLDNLRPDKKVRDITTQEIIQEGQEKPKAKMYPSTPESLYNQKLWHDAWIKRCFDPYTGKPNENYEPEEEFLKRIGEKSINE